MSRFFYGDKTILELIVEELLHTFESADIVVATSTSPNDDEMEDLALKVGVRCSRGSEDDVLRRVVDAVTHDNIEYVVRVCADNPFLRAEFVSTLLEECETSRSDYVSYALPDGTPTILSHLGLFTEVIRKETLNSINAVAESTRHREHLTSHILDFPDLYDRRLLRVPTYITNLEFLRLTVDTESDFEVCRELYADVRQKFGPQFSTEQLVDVLQTKPELHLIMAREISANEKR
jgi:spore coat polysaccharide biosynthesis protein SpsF